LRLTDHDDHGDLQPTSTSWTFSDLDVRLLRMHTEALEDMAAIIPNLVNQVDQLPLQGHHQIVIGR